MEAPIAEMVSFHSAADHFHLPVDSRVRTTAFSSSSSSHFPRFDIVRF